jgi:hypothetical protein
MQMFLETNLDTHTEILDNLVTLVIHFMRKALAMDHKVHSGKSPALLNVSKLHTRNRMVLLYGDY